MVPSKKKMVAWLLMSSIICYEHISSYIYWCMHAQVWSNCVSFFPPFSLLPSVCVCFLLLDLLVNSFGQYSEAFILILFPWMLWFQVYFAGLGRLKNVRAALCRGRALKCSRCGQPGATIGCRVDRCPKTYHLVVECFWFHHTSMFLLF